MNRTLIVTAAATLVAASLAMAQPDPAGSGPIRKHEQMRKREAIAVRLGLSDQQKEQMRKLRLEHQKEMTDLHAKIRIARLDLRELFAAEKLDRGAIEKKISAISDLQRGAKLKMLDHLFAVNALLTPEQQKIWKEHMGGMGPGPRGPMRGRGHERMMLGEGMPWMDQQPDDDAPELPGEEVD